MVLVDAIVRMADWTKQEFDHIVPLQGDEVCHEGKHRVIFVLRAIVPNHHQTTRL
jgi:hypothetical protein